MASMHACVYVLCERECECAIGSCFVNSTVSSYNILVSVSSYNILVSLWQKVCVGGFGFFLPAEVCSGEEPHTEGCSHHSQTLVGTFVKQWAGPSE